MILVYVKDVKKYMKFISRFASSWYITMISDVYFIKLELASEYVYVVPVPYIF